MIHAFLKAEDHATAQPWQYFRKVGTAQQLEEALDRLRAQGWQIVGPVESGPLDTWAVPVRRPVTARP